MIVSSIVAWSVSDLISFFETMSSVVMLSDNGRKFFDCNVSAVVSSSDIA